MVSSVLSIQDYQVYVSLGCSADEQALLQPVLLTCEISFSEEQNFESSDQLEDAIDYVQVCETLKKSARSKPYHLIEHLGSTALKEVIQYLKSSHSNLHGTVKLKSVKLRPPVENLLGGVSWTCQSRF